MATGIAMGLALEPPLGLETLGGASRLARSETSHDSSAHD
jgi:hypothetical protein